MRVKKAKDRESSLRDYYEALLRVWGPQQWWPARTRFEVIVGAYLTQNTAWTNVERALANLRKSGRLSARGIREVSVEELETLIRSSGYFRQKAARLKNFVTFLDREYGGSLAKMFAQPTMKLRTELLALNGVGPETADSILLYAGNHPVFVVDAYTRRILDRHEILAADRPYEEARAMFERALGRAKEVVEPKDLSTSLGKDNHAVIRPAPHPPSAMSRLKRLPLTQSYNEMHALIVAVGKDHCLKSQPRCEGCPLQRFLPRTRLPRRESLR